ncbi:MAG: hypothetical protein DU430_04980 [Candidatus Tokpelaia sp.]|nr:MAG: hypothetical protein DU430_04980 [Candidatus Tokpelaia sp.]
MLFVINFIIIKVLCDNAVLPFPDKTLIILFSISLLHKSQGTQRFGAIVNKISVNTPKGAVL